MDEILEEPLSITPVKLKGGKFSLITLELTSYAETTLCEQLRQWEKKLPGFFHHTPVVLIPGKRHRQTLDLKKLKKLLVNFNINLIAVKSNDEKIRQLALGAALAVFPDNKSETSIKQTGHSNDPDDSFPDTNREKSDTCKEQTVFIDRPVRSGQQVYNSHGDLVIKAPVSSGAEIIASGNVHVYSVLRGKVLAGVNGNEKARVFCQSFEAELIAISGHFKPMLSVKDKYWKKPVEISLCNNQFNFEFL